MSAVLPEPARPPAPDAANLPRGLALGAAVAASLFGPAVLSNSAAWLPTLWPVLLLTAGAALLALRGRLPAPRSVRAWTLWALGSGMLVALAVFGLGFGAVAVLAQQGALLAVVATVAWLAAVLLNAWEARRAFRGARRLQAARHTLYLLCAALLLPTAALRIADLAREPLQHVLVSTVFESLAPGLALAAGALFAIVCGSAAWQLPRWLARRQLEGRIAASAVGEAMWFVALATLLLPLAVPGVPAAPEAGWNTAGTVWGDAALRVFAVIVAYGAVRLSLGGAGSVTPIPLLVIVGPEQPGADLQRMLARLPQAWAAGPVCCVMSPRAAPSEHGAHLRLAARAGLEALLFPSGAQELHAWHESLPPIQRWRALPVQELYCEPALWRDVIATWATPQTWVLLIDAEMTGDTVRAEWKTPSLAEALPQGRALRLALAPLRLPQQDAADPGKGMDAQWPASLRHLPLWQGEPDKGSAAGFAAWLRERVRPEATRRIVLLHAPADAAWAEALSARLNGRTDAQGRFVEAWTASAGAGIDWRMPIAGFRFMLHLHVHHVLGREVPAPGGTFGWLKALHRQFVLQVAHTVLNVPETAPQPFELLLLHSDALREAAAQWSIAVPDHPVIAHAHRRIGVRLDASEEPICPLDAQLAALRMRTEGAGEQDVQQLTPLAQQILDEAWVGVAEAPVPAEAAIPEEVGLSRSEEQAPSKQAPKSQAGTGTPGAPELEMALRPPVRGLALLDDGRLCAITGDDGVSVVHPDERRQRCPATDRVDARALSALRGGRLAAACTDGSLLLWDGLNPTTPARGLRRLQAAARALVADADGLLSGGDDATLYRWPLDAEGGPHGLFTFAAPIEAIAVDADRVFVACGEAGVHVLLSGQPTRTDTPNGEAALAIDLLGDTLYVAGHDTAGRGFVRRAPLRRDGLPARELTGLAAPVTAMAALADDRVALGLDDGSVWLWSPSLGANHLQPLPGHHGTVHALQPDGAGGL
ncbi:hypothetical protein, partial [Piscinibacter sp.]|uniref:hypothetical protein n=1 Tax=Piscinibacter sp. TaxID=1903157 RepID=UPI002C48F589